MKQFVFHPLAENEAHHAANHYFDVRPGLASDFKAELAEAMNRVRENPKLYAADENGLRICPLHRFPYVLVYEELDDFIWIAAVAHHARKSDYWRRRRPL